MAMKSVDVTLEDRFVNANASAIACVWRVVRLFEGTDGVGYAALENGADRSWTKTVAIGALRDRSLFRQAG